jgi:3-oxoadipate enol-lactonase
MLETKGGGRMTTLLADNGRRIFFDDAGAGPPLLLINGHLVARTAWDFQYPLFARHFRAIRIENRDAGENDPEPASYSIADMAGDAVALLDALDIPKAHVIGHSMGVSIALRFVLDHPDRVDRLILASGRAADPAEAANRPAPPARDTWIADPRERARDRSVAVVAPGYFDSHPEQLAAVVEQERGNRITYEGMIRQREAGRDEVALPRLGKIAAPTLVIHGDRDPLIAVRYGETIAAGIRGAELRIFPGVGHRPQVERTEEFNRAVLDFLGVRTGEES